MIKVGNPPAAEDAKPRAQAFRGWAQAQGGFSLSRGVHVQGRGRVRVRVHLKSPASPGGSSSLHVWCTLPAGHWNDGSLATQVGYIMWAPSVAREMKRSSSTTTTICARTCRSHSAGRASCHVVWAHAETRGLRE